MSKPQILVLVLVLVLAVKSAKCAKKGSFIAKQAVA
jgi:hypothetical protein